jgi:hypothetical protein
MVAKTVKTPNFPQSNGELGAFCISWAIIIYSQRFLPIFPKRVGEMATPAWRRARSCEIYVRNWWEMLTKNERESIINV